MSQSKKSNRTICLKIYVTPEEYLAIKAAAEMEGESESGFGRRAIKKKLAKIAKESSQDDDD